VTVAAQVVEGGVLVAGVPQDDGVDDEAEGAELVLLAFAVALAQLPALAVEDGPGEGVPALGPVELSEDPSAVGLVVEVGEQVEGLGDPAEFGDGPPSGVGLPPALQRRLR